MTRSPEVYVFDTYFYFDLCRKDYNQMKKWTKRVNLFSKKKLIVPINILRRVHWVMICVDITKKIQYNDSLQGEEDRKE